MFAAWGVKKNGTNSIHEYIDSEVRKRKLEGKESEALVHGKLYSPKSLRKEIARHFTLTSIYLRSKSESLFQVIPWSLLVC
jgi:hypothetical protein